MSHLNHNQSSQGPCKECIGTLAEGDDRDRRIVELEEFCRFNLEDFPLLVKAHEKTISDLRAEVERLNSLVDGKIKWNQDTVNIYEHKLKEFQLTNERLQGVVGQLLESFDNYVIDFPGKKELLAKAKESMKESLNQESRRAG